MKLSAGILAGGRSSRMGRNKALLEIDNQLFLDRIAGELSDFDELFIAVDHREKYKDFSYELIEDKYQGIGPIEGIRQLLSRSANEYSFICSVDMPFLKRDLVHYIALFVCSDYDCYVMADDTGIHPLCAIYSRQVLPVIQSLIDVENYRLSEIFNRVRTKYIRIETSCFSKKLLQNVNTREEYEKLYLPKIFCVCGIKNSGKTTLIEKLIGRFVQDGKKVGVIKHDGHDFEIDTEGTDTYRFSKNGASRVGIFSAFKSAVIYNEKECTADRMLEAMDGVDIIIIEGLKGSDFPKVEVVRNEISREISCNTENLICVASDLIALENVTKPIYPLEDTDAIYCCIVSAISSIALQHAGCER